VTELMLRARAQRDEMLASTERGAVALACKIAEKIIGRDVERTPDLLVDIAATALENVRAVSAVTLRVNPRDAAILREKKKSLMELVGRVKDIAIKEDPDVPQTGCVIETDTGTFDAQLSTQLEMIQRVLLAEPSSSEGPP
ncbi:MAG: FliH/SctL family protein, partial [Myxococcaceae bacterium]